MRKNYIKVLRQESNWINVFLYVDFKPHWHPFTFRNQSENQPQSPLPLSLTQMTATINHEFYLILILHRLKTNIKKGPDFNFLMNDKCLWYLAVWFIRQKLGHNCSLWLSVRGSTQFWKGLGCFHIGWILPFLTARLNGTEHKCPEACF